MQSALFQTPTHFSPKEGNIFSLFCSCLHKHWGPEKGPFYFLVVYSLVSLDHFQSSLPTFFGFDWSLVCVYTVIISYPYSTDLDSENGDSVFFYSVGIHVHYYMVS